MRIHVRIASYIGAFLIGAVAASVSHLLFNNVVDEEWRTLVPLNTFIATDEIIFKSDLPYPSVETLIGDVKFLTGASDLSGTVRLGYKINAKMKDIDLSNIPSKYLKEKIIKVEGKTIKRLPIQQITHEVSFSFTLKDKDGFKLIELESEPHHVQSGKAHTLQGFAAPFVPDAIAERVAEISFVMVINKCTTCE